MEADEAADGRGHPGLHLEEGLTPREAETARGHPGPGATPDFLDSDVQAGAGPLAEVALEEAAVGAHPQSEPPGDGPGRLAGPLEGGGVDGDRRPFRRARRRRSVRPPPRPGGGLRRRDGARGPVPGSTLPVVGVLPWRTRSTTVGRLGGVRRLATPVHRTLSARRARPDADPVSRPRPESGQLRPLSVRQWPTPAKARGSGSAPSHPSVGARSSGMHRVVAVVLAGQPRRPPVPPAEQHHHRGHQQGAHEEGVEQDPRGQPEPDLLHLGVAGHGEHPEGAGQNEPGRGHRGAGGLDGPTDGRADGGVVGLLADPGHDQDVVVLAQGHDEDEHEEGEDEVDPVLSADDHEDQDGQPERGEVGEAHAHHQVERRHQAAQHDGQQAGPAPT